MKNLYKKIISASAAAVSLLTMFISVSATDCVSAPSYPAVSYERTAVSTDMLREALSNTDRDGVSSVEVNSTKHLNICSSVLKDLAVKAQKNNIDTVLEIVAPKVTISIDASKISNVSKVNLSMSVSNSEKGTTVSFVSKRSFGCEVKVTVKTCKMSAAELEKAHVYCGDEDLGAVAFDENGAPVITVQKGGVYVIR